MNNGQQDTRPQAGPSDTPDSAPPARLNIPEEPPKVPRRPPSTGNKRETLDDIAKRVPVELVRQYFNYPLRPAAEAMDISVTTLKRLCRRHGVKRWPHRQINGINKALNDLEVQHEVANGDAIASVAEELRELHRRREFIIELAFESEDELAHGGFEDEPPAAQKHVKRRSRTSLSDTSSRCDSSSSASSSACSSPSHSRSASIASESGRNPTGARWKGSPENGLQYPIARGARSDSSTSRGGGGGGDGCSKRPRRESDGSGVTRIQRKPKSSAIFGTIVAPSKTLRTAAASIRTDARFRHKGSGINNHNSGNNIRSASARAKTIRTTISAPSGSVPSAPKSTTAVAANLRTQPTLVSACAGSSGIGSIDSPIVGAVDTRSTGRVEMLPAAASGASVVSDYSFSSSGAEISGVGPQHDQLVDNFTGVEDLLLVGPSEEASSVAELADSYSATGSGERGENILPAQLHPGVFSYSASKWGAQGPCAPLCPQGVHSQDPLLVSMTLGSSYEHVFSGGQASASLWGTGRAGDPNGFGGVELL